MISTSLSFSSVLLSFYHYEFDFSKAILVDVIVQLHFDASRWNNIFVFFILSTCFLICHWSSSTWLRCCAEKTYFWHFYSFRTVAIQCSLATWLIFKFYFLQITFCKISLLAFIGSIDLSFPSFHLAVYCSLDCYHSWECWENSTVSALSLRRKERVENSTVPILPIFCRLLLYF